MSGILSLIREALQIVDPTKYPEKSLFFACLRVACLVAFSLLWYGEYQSRKKAERELDISRPNFEFNTGTTLWRYDRELNLTVFFIMAVILNKGHRSIARNWRATYKIGSAAEQMTSFFLRTPYVIPVGDEQITFENDDLLNVRAAKNAIERGDQVEGRLLFTLVGDRTSQVTGMQFSILYSCEDYEGKTYSSVYSPSPEPVPKLMTLAHEKARKLPTPPE